MLPDQLELVTPEVLRSLIDQRAHEGRAVEFKRELWRLDTKLNPKPGEIDKQRVEFLKDISSFANADGGHLIVGMDEEDGTAKELIGVAIAEQEAWRSRLDQLLQNWIERRIRVSMKFVQIDDEKNALVFHILPSLIGPHRVTYNDCNQFFSRNSTGAYAMSTDELRSASLPQCRCIITPWLEESHRIRGKGLTHLHLSQTVINHTFFVPPVCGSRRIHGEPLVDKNLPARPNLDQLRRQAKALLAALESGEAEAVSTILNHLPSAKRMTADQVLHTRFRLADAQSAIARKTGFAGWPHLARHVEQLRALEGTWSFARLEIDGSAIPASASGASRILINGDRFRTESPEATYEGVFNINVEVQPHEIDIEFVAGPEAGNWNYGIYRLDGQQLEICLDMNGKLRPAQCGTSSGSGHAYETLKRISQVRPVDVTGGTPSARPQSQPVQECVRFDYVESPSLSKLQGQWTPVKIVRDGQELPKMMLSTGLRSAQANEVNISFGGQTMIHALVRLDETSDPIHVDYYNLTEACKGVIQLGIMKWQGDEACFCMAAPNDLRPADFTATAGSGRTFSSWRLKK